MQTKVEEQLRSGLSEEAQSHEFIGSYLDHVELNRASGLVAIQILKVLKEMGLTQVEFARTLGMSPAALSKLLSGKENLSFRSVIKLCENLGLEFIPVIGPKTGLSAQLETDSEAKIASASS